VLHVSKHLQGMPSRPKIARIAAVSKSIPYLLLLAIPFALQAQATEQRFQTDPVDHFGSRFLTGLMVLGVVVLLYSLVRYRGRLNGAVPTTLVVAGVAIIPIAASGLGTVLVFERAEKVEFCASCHLTMQTFVDDLKDSKSESLAAVHYKNRYIADDQCYVCHTSYGIFGTVEAKKEGMIDVYKYFTRTFKLPVKLRHPYPNDDCLKCHAGSVKWLGVHGDFKDGIFSGDVHCMDCHADKNPAHIVK
jgi:cytochrome c nitrite reductase small subunit